MPDFDVNEGYVEAGRRRADSPLPDPLADERTPADGRSGQDGRGATTGRGLEAGAEGVQAGAGGRDLRRMPEAPPIVRRTRHLAEGHLSASGAVPGRRVGVKLIARRRRLARRACPYGWHVHVLGTPLRHRRRLWTLCHGR